MSTIIPLAEPSSQQWVLLCGAIILATVVVMNMRRRRRPGGSPRQYRREIDSATAQSAAIKRDMEKLLVELEGLSRNINAQIDTKFAKLERSIADADKRVSALRILIDEAKKTAGVTESTGADDAAGRAAPPATDPAASCGTRSTSSPAERELPHQGDAARVPDERYRRIYELADAGRTAVEIARELGQSAGEVELILNLRESGGPR